MVLWRCLKARESGGLPKQTSPVKCNAHIYCDASVMHEDLATKQARISERCVNFNRNVVVCIAARDLTVPVLFTKNGAVMCNNLGGESGALFCVESSTRPRFHIEPTTKAHVPFSLV